MAKARPSSPRKGLDPAGDGIPTATATEADPGQNDGPPGAEPRTLLAALKRLKKGDFAVRLSPGGTENGQANGDRASLGAEVAEAFNDVAELLEQSTRETARIVNLVGKEGRISQRARLG